MESLDNTLSTSKLDDRIDFRQGMLSAMSDELTRLLLNLDAANFKKMLDQTRNLVLEQEDDIKRSQGHIQQLEKKVRVQSCQKKKLELNSLIKLSTIKKFLYYVLAFLNSSLFNTYLL